MMLSQEDAVACWSDAMLAAAVFSAAPSRFGGIAIRGQPGPVRDKLLAFLTGLLPCSAPVRRVPLNIPDSRLLGGLDLAATLQSGRAIAERGLLSQADGGVIVLPGAERLSQSAVSNIATAVDNGEIRLERDGITQRQPASIGVIALDESSGEDECLPALLFDRLGLLVDISAIPANIVDAIPVASANVSAAHESLGIVTTDEKSIDALCVAAASLGILSLRPVLASVLAARTLAALDGRSSVNDDDVMTAARLVLAPRTMVLPPMSENMDEQAEPPPSDDADALQNQEDDKQNPTNEPLEDRVLAAVAASIPRHLLERLRANAALKAQQKSSGSAGVTQKTLKRGRPAGAIAGSLRNGARLSVVDTLRAAAPWQMVRARHRSRGAHRVDVRKDDFRIKRYKQNTGTTTIFLVDASGSAALHRLAEAKGAVELLLAECYVRRDQVALIAFRGTKAELLLPPTRSLARAKRSLSALPGGGGTPLASGLDAAALLADSIRRKGQTCVLVALTDGKANITRDGTARKAAAIDDAMASARNVRTTGCTAILIDTSPSPQVLAETLATEMGATYLPMPHAGADLMSGAVRAVATRHVKP